MKPLLIAISFFLLPFTGINAQMLAFNVEAPPELNITVISDGELDFGSLLQNQGLVQIPLSDPGTEIISIEGPFNENISITITAPPALQLDPSNILPYTLGAAYANQGEDNKSQAVLFQDNTAIFRIKEGGAPGGGPGGGAPTATAYLYIFGEITVGNVNAGTYSGVINIFVEYD